MNTNRTNATWAYSIFCFFALIAATFGFAFFVDSMTPEKDELRMYIIFWIAACLPMVLALSALREPVIKSLITAKNPENKESH